MTHGYGEDMASRRRDQYRDESEEAAGPDVSYHSRDWPQQPQYEPPRPPQSGVGQYGSRPQAMGYGGRQAPQGYQAEPPAGYHTPGRNTPPHSDIPTPSDMAQPNGPYRGGGYVGTTPYGGNPRQYGNATPYGGMPGQYGAGRGPQPYGSDRYQPQASFDEPGQADAGPKSERRSHKLLIIAIIVVVLVVGGGGGGWYFLHRESNGPASNEVAQKVADQKVDPIPLTATEVFGSGTIPSSADGGGSYKVIKTQASTDCKTAVGGDIATALTTAGCTQVVRATLTSPDGAYVITAGIFNLTDAAKASTAPAAIKTAIEAHKGRFSGLVAGGSTNVIELAAANVAWDVRGHYLMYCLIANADGSAIAANNSQTHLIISDVVESYLGGMVIHKRETSGGPAAVTSTRPS
jgi:hypothetical protein